ncbi:uronate dehydrogenase [Devosia lucknowensis]|uniref:Uronate dehydrogenase n=1 Tax=Devosia lucknowensis TaxID=1096929 RepID=A0A1Y6G6P7_9HYPH|nr:NAD(P)-dependent oxidoreductase [Devosia lucknowensis]SMQ85766.1 uronate dehydrogenase [Devosia lucknowensis]
MRRILLTGAAGGIGSMLRENLLREGEVLRLCDIAPMTAHDGDEVVMGDLADADFAMDVCRDVDAIVHMAGQAKEGPWEKLVGPNLIATTNLWEAARVNGVERVVFGSSNHVVGMYPVGLELDPSDITRPDSRYGATKVFAEAVASLYADKYGIKSFLVRIGTFAEKPENIRALSTWISPRDLAAIVRLGLDADYHCETVFGVSRNTRAWCDNSRAFALGYDPQDNAEDYLAQVDPNAGPQGPVASSLQGGGSAAKEFSGDIDLLRRRVRP